MKKVWIIVANSGQSTIYKAEANNHLTPYKHFNHEESHMAARDLVSDNQGRNSNPRMFGSETYSDKTSIKTKESMIFAHELSKTLDEGLKHGDYERLYIVAKAPFLGHLREALPTHVTKMIHAEVSKDLSQLKPEQIREYLPPVL